MAEDSFDFSFAARAWTWRHSVGSDVVGTSTRNFRTLHECMADARLAGFHGSGDTRRNAPTGPGDGALYAER